MKVHECCCFPDSIDKCNNCLNLERLDQLYFLINNGEGDYEAITELIQFKSMAVPYLIKLILSENKSIQSKICYYIHRAKFDRTWMYQLVPTLNNVISDWISKNINNPESFNEKSDIIIVIQALGICGMVTSNSRSISLLLKLLKQNLHLSSSNRIRSSFCDISFVCIIAIEFIDNKGKCVAFLISLISKNAKLFRMNLTSSVKYDDSFNFALYTSVIFPRKSGQ